MTDIAPMERAALSPGIDSRFVRNINGLDMHLLEAGYGSPGRPLILLLHGFPELAYSWRKVMLPLAALRAKPDLLHCVSGTMPLLRSVPAVVSRLRRVSYSRRTCAS